MRLLITPAIPVTIQSRRGSRVLRKMDFTPQEGVAIDYPALDTSDLEIHVDGKLHKSIPVGLNPKRTERVALNVQVVRENGTTPVGGSSPKNDDNVQPVGGKGTENGGAVSRPLPVQVPSVDRGNAQQRSPG